MSTISLGSGQMHTSNFDDLFIWLIGYLLMLYIMLLIISYEIK